VTCVNDLLRLGTAAFLLALLAAAARAEDERGPIQDNLFLLEEAYNQEPGVIQHISLLQRDRRTGDWVYTFTEEWPAHGQAHQASVTLQVARVDDPGGTRTGFGDLALNYRWQAVGDGDAPVAVAPRLTVVLPTGDWRRGLGEGGVGLQAALPVSAVLGRQLVAHFDLGATLYPSQRTAASSSAVLLVGEALVWLAHPNLNVLVEAAYTVAERHLDAGGTAVDESFLLSPGLRGAIDAPFGLQVVMGAALPFGFGPSRGERGLLLYLSFEHPVTKHPW
jgi:hypothetical protein